MCTSRSCMSLVVNYQNTLATFRLEYKDDYKYKFTVLSTRFWLAGQKNFKLVLNAIRVLQSEGRY